MNKMIAGTLITMKTDVKFKLFVPNLRSWNTSWALNELGCVRSNNISFSQTFRY